MNLFNDNKKSILLIFVIYTVANIFLLLNYNGIYWDDWVLYNHSFETINNMFQQSLGASGYPISSMHYLLMEIGNGVIGYRVLTVVLLFFSGFFVHKILQTLRFFSKKDCFFITIFFLLAPLYSAKVALIDFPYTFFSTVFFYAFYLTSKNIKKLSLIKRLFILFLFFSSFIVNSILVFYTIVLIYIFYKWYKLELSFLTNVALFVHKYLDFILLPIVFYIIKIIYFVPSGLYVGYNSIKLKNLFNAKLYAKSFYYSFIEPLQLSILHTNYLLIGIGIGIIILLNFKNIFKLKNNVIKEKDIYLFLLGVIIFILGAFAYIVVGKIPNLSDWNSRFQLLLPLGFSFMLYYLINITSCILKLNKNIRYYIFALIIFSFTMFQLRMQFKYNIDWLYQQSIIENLQSSKVINSNNTFIYSISLKGKLANNRRIRFYELNGMSREAFGIDDKVYNKRELSLEIYKNPQKPKQYNYSSWNYSSPPVHIKISDNLDKMKTIDKLVFFLNLKYLELFNKDKFESEIKKLIVINL